MPQRPFVSALLACLIILPATAQAEVPDEFLSSPLAEIFGAPPSLIDPMLSPDGSHLVFLAQTPEGVMMLRTLNLETATLRTPLQGSVEGHDILWCDFTHETRLLCDLRQGLPGRATEWQLFYSLNLDGTEPQQMLRGVGCGPQQPLSDKPPFDRIGGDSEEVLFVCGPSATYINAYSRSVRDISGAGEIGREQRRLYPNGHGLGNVYAGRTDDTVYWLVRETPEAGAWEEFLVQNPVEWEPMLRPVGYGPATDRLFNIGWDQDSETWGLFRQNLNEPHENEHIFSDPYVDIELVDTMGRHDRVVSVAYLDGRARRAIVDRRVGEVYQFISELLPQVDIEIIDESWDQNFYLARARAERRAGELLLIDMENQQVQALLPEYAQFQVSDYELAETQLVQFEGSDGGPITAHLTLPPNRTGPVPAVIIPRSRASHEQIADPHYLVEYLAASGFAVLRVQNRVDQEFGRGWLPERAVIGWGQTADDLSSAADFLVSQGITPPNRFCAAGMDYGAYSSFMSAIKYPELFSCIVSIAGVADPRLTPGAWIIRRGISRMGDDVLDEGSPVIRAAEVVPPILMFHGENDDTVSMADHSVTLSNVLDRADKDVQFIEYPYGDHRIRRGPYRIDMLTRIGEFLDQHIGPSDAGYREEEGTAAGPAEEPEMPAPTE